MAHLGFDSTTVEPSKGFDLIPVGEYVAEIIESNEKATQKGDGKYISLTWQISEGQYAKRRLWVNLNLDNPNPEAVNIAKAELSAICRAVGVLKPNDSSELHLKRCRIKIMHRKNKQSNEMEARIAKYDPMAGAAAVAGSTAAPGGAPWQKRA